MQHENESMGNTTRFNAVGGVHGLAPASIAKEDEGHAARIRRETKRFGEAADKAVVVKKKRMSVRRRRKGSRGIVAECKAEQICCVPLQVFLEQQKALSSCGWTGVDSC
jgi:hypothetical protein